MGSNHQILNYYLSAWLAGIFTGVTIICGIVLLSSRTSADSTTANATVTVGSACTMTAIVNTAHTAEVPGGTTKTDIGSTTLNTICNDAGGYAIYAVGYSGDEYGNNKMINGTNEINTGTGSSASNWNMSLSQVTTGTYATTIDGGFGSYSAIPATYTKVAHRDSMTDSTTGSSISLTYGAYVASTQAPGDYVGKVKFTMVHPASEIPPQPQITEAGCIRYYPNGSNVEGTMGCQSISATDTSATLLASNYSREGYGFAGWSTTFDYSSSGGFLGPQEYITFDAGQYTGNSQGLSLYAYWVKSAGSLQNWSGCSSLASGAVTALTDQRDNETYAIAKLADGNCWMIENMRLENTNSDNATGALAQGYGGQFAGLATTETPWTSNNPYTVANSKYSIDGSNDTINIGSSYATYRFPRYNNQNITSRASNPPGNSTNLYSYGNYYTWATAVADTTSYTTENTSVTTTSICPSGWRLPIGGNKTNEANNEFWALVVNGLNNGTTPANYESEARPFYASSSEAGQPILALRTYPNNFIYSAYIYGSSIYNRGSYGLYWASTTFSSSAAYRLYFYNNNLLDPGTAYSYKNYGGTIRCLVSDA